VTEAIAIELNRFAREEPPLSHLRDPPLHGEQYTSLIGHHVQSGPAFTFPQAIPQPLSAVLIEDEQLLERHFRGWVVGEIAAGRVPVMAIVENGYPVSVCFSARWSDVAAEAGVETARAFQGRGLAPRVTAAWALAVRASGRIPLYSTDWSNAASLAVARKLGLEAYAANWSVLD
jgi:RimJ/RimL family protein N-acetyltransferase